MGKATIKNDSYWSYGDIKACWKSAYKSGTYNPADAAKCLRTKRQSARKFLQLRVALAKNDEEKLMQLLFLDKINFNSWQEVAERLRRSGSELAFPYTSAVKKTLVDMKKDKDTLYSCIETERKTPWEYLPI